MKETEEVSQQAFLEELQSWAGTLGREAKKLKHLRKAVGSKLQINTIDIALINIESELIQYKKIRERVNEKGSQLAVIELYTALSKRFLNVMGKIGEAAENERYKHSPSELDPPNTAENLCPNKPKHFLEETFNHRIGKQATNPKNKSVLEPNKHLNQMRRQNSKAKGKSKAAKSSENSRSKTASLYTNLNRLELEQQEDLSDVRYQLKEIKSLMSQMEKEIRLHGHDEVEREVGKLGQTNKRMALDLKSLREDSQFVMTRLQHLKEELAHQKDMQAEMIRKIENARESRVQVHSISRDHKETEDVSEWVKIRI